jgi:sulfur-carrier protein adenylyltransferase/sulfurtransferase
MNITQNEYFKRQSTLSEIGEEGQQLLQKSKVVVIGCGGLGSPIAIYLATSGIGELHIVDFDTVSISNLHRQVFFKVEDIKKPKVEVLANEIKKRAPFTKVSFTNEAVNKNSILDLISTFDIVVDGTDNLQIKYLINDACVLANKPLVYGSLYKFDGYVSTFNVSKEDGSYTCNLRDAFPKIATDIPNCEEAGTMNPIVGIIAILQVNEVIKFITKTGKLLIDKLLIYNVLENTQFKIKLKKNNSLDILNIYRDSTYLDVSCETQNPDLLISSTQLKNRISDKNVEIISVINNLDTAVPFKVHQKIQHKNFNVNNFNPNLKKEYIIICNKGISSYDITIKLKTKYPNLKVFSLSEGIEKYF